jgi:RecA/RadA recombinase
LTKCQVRLVLALLIREHHSLESQPGGGGFQTAHELGQQRKRVLKISTGSKQLDTVLGG